MSWLEKRPWQREKDNAPIMLWLINTKSICMTSQLMSNKVLMMPWQCLIIDQTMSWQRRNLIKYLELSSKTSVRVHGPITWKGGWTMPVVNLLMIQTRSFTRITMIQSSSLYREERIWITLSWRARNHHGHLLISLVLRALSNSQKMKREQIRKVSSLVQELSPA